MRNFKGVLGTLRLIQVECNRCSDILQCHNLNILSFEPLEVDKDWA